MISGKEAEQEILKQYLEMSQGDKALADTTCENISKEKTETELRKCISLLTKNKDVLEMAISLLSDDSLEEIFVIVMADLLAQVSTLESAGFDFCKILGDETYQDYLKLINDAA